MKRTLYLTLTFILLLSVFIPSCAPKQQEVSPSQFYTVKRGDFSLTISSDGYLEMPNEAKLKFGAPGIVKSIFVKKGDEVRAGRLLCRLDDTKQLLAVEAAQYSLEMAINNVIQTCCGARYPTFYTMATALLRFEQAQAEVMQARDLLQQKQYVQAASSLSLAEYDLKAVHDIYANPRRDTLETQYNEINQPVPFTPDYSQLLSMLDVQITSLTSLIKQMESGNYQPALAAVDNLAISLEEAHGAVKNNSRLPGAFTYPDTSTVLAISRQVLDSLSQIQSSMQAGNYDPVVIAQKLQMAQHDLLMSNKVLDEKETIYRAGLNLQTLRTYNLNIDTAIVNLEKAKQDLLDTEIYAPFDGVVVDVPVKINDRLSAFDYASKVAIHLVDTGTIRVTGTIDEIDIPKVKIGQEALITADALPGRKLKGHVTFVSPLGILQSGVVNFPVEIYLDANEDYTDLRGGLTATADIIVQRKSGVLMVPTRGVKGLPGNYFVQVINPSTQKMEKRPVTTGLQSNAYTEIVSGLNEGETVYLETSR